MKRVLYILNDCKRKFTYERTAGLHAAFQRMGEPVDLYIVRSDGFSDFAPEHNCGEYNIFRLPDYRDFDGIFLDINSVFATDSDACAAEAMRYAVRSAREAGKPVISMASDIEGFYYVGIDNYTAMQSVIRYLHGDLGLTDFWFVMGPADNFENLDRTRALRDYCAENGIPFGDDRYYADSFILQCGLDAFETLYARNGRLPEAVICCNDYVALGVCQAAEKAGFEIPRDVLVTGFDNDEVSDYISPSITTVDQSPHAMVEACADTMLRVWRGEDVPLRVRTPTKLILRESTRHPIKQGNMKKKFQEYLDQTFSNRDFRYKLTVLQYQLPACKSLEEIGGSLVRCLSGLGCRGVALILDSDLVDGGYMSQYEGSVEQIRDMSDDMPVHGYSDNLELVFIWDKGKELRVVRQKVERTLTVMEREGEPENYLFMPLHFMEHTVGYLVIRDCFYLVRIKGMTAIVNNLTMALRSYFSRKSLAGMNRLLSGISMKDELTGLYNRLGYHKLAYPLFRELGRRGGCLGILFVDMDRLKLINDTHGHAAGDRAIRALADAVARNVPDSALTVRYGGDEFLVLVPDADSAALTRLLAVFAGALPAEAKRLGAPELLDFSAGFVVSDPADGRTLDECVQEADTRMYAEKKRKKRERM